MLSAFVLETGVDILSRARVRVIHRACLRRYPRLCTVTARSWRGVFLCASGNYFRFRASHPAAVCRAVAEFSSAVSCLAGHGKLRYRRKQNKINRPRTISSMKTDCIIIGHKNKSTQLMLSAFVLETGVDILSRAVSSQVPSARMSLTSVFGMRTGGTSSP